jgi:hypothetical protein
VGGTHREVDVVLDKHHTNVTKVHPSATVVLNRGTLTGQRYIGEMLDTQVRL